MTAVWDLVIEDMRARDAIGERRYGTRLLDEDDTRDTLKDAYEEALDLAVYLKKAMLQRDRTKEIMHGLTERIKAQSDLLAKRAEKEKEPCNP